jgi:hypothetical protein
MRKYPHKKGGGRQNDTEREYGTMAETGREFPQQRSECHCMV